MAGVKRLWPLALLLLSACGGDDGRLRIFAAVSVTEVVTELLPAKSADVSFGGSGMLARQIRDGAPADLFISASRDWMDWLEQEGALEGKPIVIATNRLVCIAPQGSELAARTIQDLTTDNIRLIALADENVPAGRYAREALGEPVLKKLRGRLLGLTDVRAVLRAVADGQVDAGIVYATDARVADVRVLFKLPLKTPIEYYAAVIKEAKQKEAAESFLKHLQSDEGGRILAEHGFNPDRRTQNPEP